MPSPIAHAAAGFVVYQAYRSRLPAWAETRVGLAILVFIGLSLVPDLDLLPAVVLGDLKGIHNGITNSVVTALVISAALGVVISRIAGGRFLLWFSAAIASISLHILMDYFAATRGIMAFWPITSDRFVAPVKLFYGFHYSEGLISIRHLWTALSELAFAAVLVTLAVLLPRIGKKTAQPALD